MCGLGVLGDPCYVCILIIVSAQDRLASLLADTALIELGSFNRRHDFTCMEATFLFRHNVVDICCYHCHCRTIELLSGHYGLRGADLEPLALNATPVFLQDSSMNGGADAGVEATLAKALAKQSTLTLITEGEGEGEKQSRARHTTCTASAVAEGRENQQQQQQGHQQQGQQQHQTQQQQCQQPFSAGHIAQHGTAGTARAVAEPQEEVAGMGLEELDKARALVEEHKGGWALGIEAHFYYQ